MIQLSKFPIPDVLRDNEESWTEAFLIAHAAGTVTNSIKYRYRDPKIKHTIIEETAGKCAYCESKIRHTYPGDIEHILPQSLFPLLIFDWANLTLACNECNRRKLNYHNPAEPLINPYLDNPDDHLLALGPLVKSKLNDRKGQITELKLELNRTPLVERRIERIEALHNLAHRYAVETGVLKNLLAEQLRKEAENDKEYAFIVRGYLQQCVGLTI